MRCVLALLLVGCTDHYVLSNGNNGELTAEVYGDTGGVLPLSSLPIGAPAELVISRWEQSDDDNGRRTYFVSWTTNMPTVRFSPPDLVEIGPLVLDPEGEFLEFTLTPTAAGRGLLSVTGDQYADGWDVTLTP